MKTVGRREWKEQNRTTKFIFFKLLNYFFQQIFHNSALINGYAVNFLPTCSRQNRHAFIQSPARQERKTGGGPLICSFTIKMRGTGRIPEQFRNRLPQKVWCSSKAIFYLNIPHHLHSPISPHPYRQRTRSTSKQKTQNPIHNNIKKIA